MATYKSKLVDVSELVPGVGTGVTDAVPRPEVDGTPTLGDTIFHALVVPNGKKDTYVPESGAGFAQIGSWVVGEADAFGVPAFGLFAVTFDGVQTSYTWTFDQDATRGANIMAVCYSGNCTVRQIGTNTDTDGAGARSGPTLTVPATNTAIVFHGGSSSGAATVSFGGGFTERWDYGYFGLNAGADQAGDGGPLTPTLTPTASTQSMWIMVDVGGDVDADTFVPRPTMTSRGVGW